MKLLPKSLTPMPYILAVVASAALGFASNASSAGRGGRGSPPPAPYTYTQPSYTYTPPTYTYRSPAAPAPTQ